MKTKITLGIALVIVLAVVSIAYFYNKVEPTEPITEPAENGTPVETETPIDNVYAGEIEIIEGADPKTLPPAEDIPLIEVCIQIPAEAEESVKNMAMVGVERWLRNQKATEVQDITNQVKSNLKAIKDTNNIEDEQ